MSRMPVHSIVEAPTAESFLLTIGRAGVLSSRRLITPAACDSRRASRRRSGDRAAPPAKRGGFDQHQGHAAEDPDLTATHSAGAPSQAARSGCYITIDESRWG